MHPFSILGWGFAVVVVSVGTVWAFKKGAHDFSVFYEAWALVLQGRGAEIYHETPDRFLYAPGFAWILSPLAWIPREAALALWCLAKAAVLIFMVRAFSFSSTAGIWGVVLLSRPLLIDLQYGQVNVLILGACAWALLGHLREKQALLMDFLSWAVLGFVAMAKVFPLPLLLIPFWVTKTLPSKKIWTERMGILLGIVTVGLAPLCTEGIQGTVHLYSQWKEALIAKGLPLESHNQSFSAFLHHYFSGVPTHVIARGIDHPVLLGSGWLTQDQISVLSMAWFFMAAGILLGWILRSGMLKPLHWISVVLGLMILPSHLVWKPYFVFGLPAAILAVSAEKKPWFLLVGVLLLENFSGFDWVGDRLGAHLEGGSVLLWVHLALISFTGCSVAWNSRKRSFS